MVRSFELNWGSITRWLPFSIKVHSAEPYPALGASLTASTLLRILPTIVALPPTGDILTAENTCSWQMPTFGSLRNGK